MSAITYSDVGNYVNYKPKGLQDERGFSDHQYSVVRHEIIHKPGMNGMVTIKVCKVYL